MQDLTDKQRAGMVSVAAAVFMLALLALPLQARAAVGDAFVDACLNGGAAKPNCAVSPGITGAFPQVLSPNGRQLYVAVNGNGGSEVPAVLTFDRNPESGALTRRPNGCVTKTGSSGACVAAPQLGNPQDMVVSPDGTTVYVSNAATSSIIELRRAPDGSLTLINECQGTGAPCTAVTGMGVPHSLAISPDGTTLYARTTQSGGQGQGFGTLLVFTRLADGRLTQKTAPEGCWSELAQGSCRTASGISRQGWQMAVTNTHVYTVGHNDSYIASITPGCGFFCVNTQAQSGTVAVFGRNPNGTLTQAASPAGCISNNGFSGGGGVFSGAAPVRCSDGSDALDQARSVVLSPDGRSVYVGTQNAIITYARNTASGALTQQGCLRRTGTGIAGCIDATAIGDVHRMAVTPDGTGLIANSNTFNGFAFLTRSASTGALTQKAGTKRCITRDGSGGACETLPALGGYGSVTVSQDSTFVHLATNDPGAVVTMHRDFAPTCDTKTVPVPYQTSVVVPLTCADHNGDPLTLAITSQPLNGSLGGGGTIDTSNNTVRYSPPLGFTGTDTFTFTAAGRGVTSAPATITLDVAPPPPDTGGIVLPAGVDADGDGFFAGQECNDGNRDIRPGALEIKGNRIDENCDGIAEPFPTLGAGVATSWDAKGKRITLKSLKVTQQFPPGWKVKIICKGKPKCTFKQKNLKKGKVRRSASNVIGSLKKKQRVFRAGQTVEVWVSAPGFNTKVSRYKLKRNKIPTTQPFCVVPGQTRPQKTCS
jgi:6-phosphogluconolactonase (cycloisomerase 2 family)